MGCANTSDACFICNTVFALTAPEGAVNCYPCPDHWTNWVGVAYKSGHVTVKGADGRSLGLAKDWIYDCAIVQMCNCANEEMGIC